MSEKTVRFDNLVIRRAGGFVRGGMDVESLCGGINVVYGHNASGKTTLAQAIQTLLWPQSGPLDDAQLAARFHIGETSWSIDFDRGRTIFQRNGVDVEHGPDLVPEETRDRYYLGLHELLAAQGDGFARSIVRESAGGYDVTAAGESLGISLGTLRKRKSTKQLRRARRQWSEARAAQKELHRRARRLDELQRCIEQAQQASRRADAVQMAIEYRKADDERRRLEKRLDEFPDAIERVAGDEGETLDRLRERLDSTESRIERADRSIVDCRRRLDDNLLDDQLDDGTVVTLEEYADELDELRRQRRSLRQQRADAESRRDRARARITGETGVGDAPDVDAGDVDELMELADEWTDIRGRARGYDVVSSLIGETDSEVDGGGIEEGIRLLQRWLAEPNGSEKSGESVSKAMFFALVASTVVIAGLAVLLGILVHPLGWLLMAVAIVLGRVVVALKKHSGANDGGESSRDVYRRDFERLDIAAPDEWNDKSVRNHLDSLSERWTDIRLECRKRELWNSHAAQRKRLAEQREQCEKRRRTLSKRFGLDLEENLAKTGWLLGQLGQWQRAHDEAEGLNSQIEANQRRYGEVVRCINEVLESLGLAQVEDIAGARGRIKALREAKQQFETAKTELRAAEKDKDAARTQAGQIQSDIVELFDRLGIDDESDAVIEKLCGQKSDYDEVREEWIGARRAADDKKRKVQRHLGESQELLELSVDELEIQRTKLQKRAESLDELKNEKRDLEKEIELAKESTQIEERRAEYEARRDCLRREREEDYRKAVGEALVEHVRETTRDRNRPRVFHRARELFSDITRGRYRLELAESDNEPVFRAWDNNKSRGFALEALSSGTRVQLLLAVRMAFVECQEHGPKLPMVLDETLANSDDDRARAIIRAIEQIGAGGRQTFYFTAQQDEVRKWRAFAENSQLECSFIALDEQLEAQSEARFVALDEPGEDFAAPEPPGEAAHDEYGAMLGVAGSVGPFTPVTDVHLWYFIEDVDVLYRTLKMGVIRWGQLCELAERSGLEAVDMDVAVFAAIEARAAAVEAFLKAYRVGRGRRVDRRVLEESGAISETFIDRVTRLCEEVDGEAERLVAGLRQGEVKRFRSSKADELEEYLIAEGYLDAAEPLDPDEIWLRVMAEVSEQLGAEIISEEELKSLLARFHPSSPGISTPRSLATSFDFS